MFFACENSASLLNNGLHVVSFANWLNVEIAKFILTVNKGNSLVFRLVCILSWRLSLSLSLSFSLFFSQAINIAAIISDSLEYRFALSRVRVLRERHVETEERKNGFHNFQLSKQP